MLLNAQILPPAFLNEVRAELRLRAKLDSKRAAELRSARMQHDAAVFAAIGCTLFALAVGIAQIVGAL
jgi:hypothetical protein